MVGVIVVITVTTVIIVLLRTDGLYDYHNRHLHSRNNHLPKAFICLQYRFFQGISLYLDSLFYSIYVEFETHCFTSNELKLNYMNTGLPQHEQPARHADGQGACRDYRRFQVS